MIMIQNNSRTNLEIKRQNSLGKSNYDIKSEDYRVHLQHNIVQHIDLAVELGVLA